MNAQPSQTHRPHVTVKKDTNVILRMNINSISGVVTQTSTTTTETWTGLLYADAETLCETYEQSILNGVTRSYLGGIKLTISTGGTSIWNTKESCWGKKLLQMFQESVILISILLLKQPLYMMLQIVVEQCNYYKGIL